MCFPVVGNPRVENRCPKGNQCPGIPIVWNAENGHFEDTPSKSAQQSTYSVPGTRPESRSLDTLPISESTVLSE